LFLYIKYNVNNPTFTIKLITPAITSEISIIKYPCNNQSKLVVKISDKDNNDKSLTLFVTYVLYN